jgi:hypothetical protein
LNQYFICTCGKLLNSQSSNDIHEVNKHLARIRLSLTLYFFSPARFLEGLPAL